MSNSIFRKESLDKIATPNDLNNYLRVTNPSVWIVLLSVVVLIVGAMFWATFSTVETKAPAMVISKGGTAECFVSEKFITEIKSGMTIRCEGKEYEITSVGHKAISANDVFDDYERKLVGFKSEENIYALYLDGSLGEGRFAAKIVLESVSPISFLTNDGE